MSALAQSLHEVTQRIRDAARGREICLVAVSKTQPASAIAELADAGQTCFGENYVQEALPKIDSLAGRRLDWHLIGNLQSNKAREAANRFGCVQTVDRARIAQALARHRDPALGPLDVLAQVNIDDEASKSGCTPAELPALLDAIATLPQLRLRGLMAIPRPCDALDQMRASFAAMRSQFDYARRAHPGMDTLSMGMSGDYTIAIEEGATLVRIGSALFGQRSARPGG